MRINFQIRLLMEASARGGEGAKARLSGYLKERRGDTVAGEAGRKSRKRFLWPGQV